MHKRLSRAGTPSPISQRLEAAFVDRSARVGIIGQGYVGLPLAMTISEAGFDVTGFEINADTVSALLEGRSHIDDVPDAQVAAQHAAGRYRATTDMSGLAACDVVSVCVPTPISEARDPDTSYIEAAITTRAPHLRVGQLVVLESTTFPGTTRELVLPMLERPGLEVGVDFFLAFSPERVDPGNEVHTIHNTPRIIGGVTTLCTALASTFYGSFIDQMVPVSSADAAEAAKLLENTFRAVNIGFVNELAVMCDLLGLDVWEVIDAASTKPFGFMRFEPGPGLGGHCIPVDPHYLSWSLRRLNYTARYIELATDINAKMPRHVLSLVAEALNHDRKAVNGARVLVLGVAYKSDISDTRESAALEVLELLMSKGAEVTYHDPHVPSLRLTGQTIESVALSQQAVEAADVVVIVTAHRSIDYAWLGEHARAIVDTRNAMAPVDEPSARVVLL